jgi:hypothetical protein
MFSNSTEGELHFIIPPCTEAIPRGEATVGRTFDIGLAIVAFFLGALVKEIPSWIAVPGILVGTLCLIYPYAQPSFSFAIRTWFSAGLIVAFLSGAIMLHVTNAETDQAYFRIVCAIDGDLDKGPYQLMAFNNAKNPFTNVSIRITDTKEFLTPSPYQEPPSQIGDLEVGVTQLRLPMLTRGIYQIDMYSREGRFTEMLQVLADMRGVIHQTMTIQRWSDGKILLNTAQ